MSDQIKSYIMSLENTYFGRRIKNYRVSFMALFLLVLYGSYSLVILPKESSPTIKFGIVQVTTVYPGANPVDIDDIITEKIEDSVKDLKWVDKVESRSSLWVSSVTITLENGIDTKDFVNEAKLKVDSLNFPDDVFDPNVSELSTDNEVLFEMMIYGSQEYFTMNQVRSLAMDMKDSLKWQWSIVDVWVDGVAGESDYNIWVYLDQWRVEDLGLTVWWIVSQIRAYNSNLPLGNHTVWELNYDYRINNELTDIGQMQEIPINIGTRYVTLAELASITRSYKTDDVTYGWVGGSENNYAVNLTIFKKAGGSIFSDADEAKQLINEEIRKVKYRGISMIYTRDLSEIIIEDYISLWRNGVSAILLVTIITAFFIGIRQSIIATIAMIVSFFITFIILQLLWLTLNFLTNFSLILAFGSGIDTVIVFIEAAYANMKRWFNPKSAMLIAVNTYKSANINTSLINLCVFIPLLILPGITGKFLSFIPITIFTTLLGSLLMSLTVNNALFYKLNKPWNYYFADSDDNEDDDVILSEVEQAILDQERTGKQVKPTTDKPAMERIIDKMMLWYVAMLRYLLETKLRRSLTIRLPIVAVILSFVLLAPNIGFKLFPSGDNPFANIVIEAKEWTSIWSTIVVSEGIDAIIAQIPEIKSYDITVKAGQIRIGTVLIDKELRDRDSFQIQDDILVQLWYLTSAWYRIEGQVQAWWPPTGKAVWIKIVAVDKTKLVLLKSVSEDFELYLKSLTGTVNVTNSNTTSPGQFEIVFDRDKLAQLWLTPQDIQFEINNVINGQKAWTINLESVERDIVVQYDEFRDEVTPSQIMDLTITTRTGPVKISAIAKVVLNQSLTSIARSDGQIVATVESDLQPWLTPTNFQPQLIAFADSYEFPAGIAYTAGGENQANADLIQGALIGLVIAILLAFIILVYQFNSYSLPAIVIYSIFTAFLWVNLWLRATGNPYSMAVLIWFISLIWVVVNTAIFLVDRFKANMEKWAEVVDAIIEAGQVRFTPIVISTITALLWVWPVVTQDEFYAGLWYTVIFGLVFSAGITLLAVPMLIYWVKYEKPRQLAEKIDEVLEEWEENI